MCGQFSDIFNGLMSIQNQTLETGNSSVRRLFCSEDLNRFHVAFSSFYGYISLCVCLFGAVNNVINILVLTRKEMRSSTSTILTGLAVADLMVMLEYIPFTLHHYLLYQKGQPEKYTHPWAMFILFHAHFTQLFHTVSIWLTVTLAIWRCLYVKFTLGRKELCSNFRAIMAVTSAYIFPPVLCLPVFLSLHIEEMTNKRNETVYIVKGVSKSDTLKSIHFWTYGVAIKLIPCILLTFLIANLISVIVTAQRRRKCLKSVAKHSCKNLKPRHGSSDVSKDRTTLMLLVILILFLVSELPQGILSLLTALLSVQFYEECVNPLDEVIDLLALINSAVNFFLYCYMSSQFQQTLKKILCRMDMRSVAAQDSRLEKASVRLYPTTNV